MRNMLRYILICCSFSILAASAGHAMDSGGAPVPAVRLVGLPATAVFFDGVELHNGDWHIRYLLPNWPGMLELRRFSSVSFHPKTVSKLVEAEWPDVTGLVISEYSALSAKSGYPALKVEFQTGRNEDTQQHLGAFVLADAMVFWFDVSASVDTCIEGLEETVSEKEFLVEEMGRILLGIALADATQRFYPDGVTRVYALEGADITDMGVPILSTLVRIRRTINPDENGGTAGVAYRYDGVGEVDGAPSHLFAYGTDHPESFIAERYFAGNENGEIFEMDFIVGGEYRRVACDEKETR